MGSNDNIVEVEGFDLRRSVRQLEGFAETFSEVIGGRRPEKEESLRLETISVVEGGVTN